ncbi:hypothetical protein KR067_010988 [Drosophila pandora]|nr:hypothetical protein KR067_010988 [Drosophila pandora]
MGNVMDRKVSCAEARNVNAGSPPSLSVTDPTAALQEKKLDPEIKKNNKQPQELVPNLTFHLFSYRQQMGCKKHQLLKWATSKLLLTEELLRKHNRQPPTKSWTNFDTIEVSDDDEDEENRAPAEDVLERELCHLKNYRLALRGTIVEVAQEKMKKREKKKLKRLKRRTLISSKKPSKKDKYKHCQMPTNEHTRSQDNPPMEVIVID